MQISAILEEYIYVSWQKHLASSCVWVSDPALMEAAWAQVSLPGFANYFWTVAMVELGFFAVSALAVRWKDTVLAITSYRFKDEPLNWWFHAVVFAVLDT